MAKEKIMIWHSKILKLACLFLICWLPAANLSGQVIRTDTVSVHPFGKVAVSYTYSKSLKNLIIMISSGKEAISASHLLNVDSGSSGSAVAEVNTGIYYRHLKQLKTGCYHVFSDFVELATEVERKYNFTDYVPPVLVGSSEGAELVYGILAQSRPGTFIGGISVGFCPEFESPGMLCQTYGLREKVIAGNLRYAYLPDPDLGTSWIVIQSEPGKSCNEQAVDDFVTKTRNASLVSYGGTGRGQEPPADAIPLIRERISGLIRKYNASNTSGSDQVDETDLSRIPYNITREKVATGTGMIAVILSGDGGWYAFEQSLANNLAGNGIAVLGLDTKKYFWNRKTPEQTAGDIADLLKYYGNKWGKREFMLFGYSQGAEIVPFIYNRLPESVRAGVRSLVMLSPEATTDFEIHISNMIGWGNRENTYQVIPEIKKIKECRQIIIYGDDEKTDMPGLLKDTNARIVTVPGRHHYQGNASLIVKEMKENGAF